LESLRAIAGQSLKRKMTFVRMHLRPIVINDNQSVMMFRMLGD